MVLWTKLCPMSPFLSKSMLKLEPPMGRCLEMGPVGGGVMRAEPMARDECPFKKRHQNFISVPWKDAVRRQLSISQGEGPHRKSTPEIEEVSFCCLSHP